MAVNRERPHLLVLPEDDATRSVAVGFIDHTRGQMQVLNPAGGWPKVQQAFQDKYIKHLTTYTQGHIVLLIDFDDDVANRFAAFQAVIPPAVAARVYVIGAMSEAETLRNATGKKYGVLGAALAEECRNSGAALWGCPQLACNQPEVARLVANVKPFLF